MTSSKMAANTGDHDLFGFRFTEIYNFFSVRFLKNTISFFHSSNSMLAKENPTRGHLCSGLNFATKFTKFTMFRDSLEKTAKFANLTVFRDDVANTTKLKN